MGAMNRESQGDGCPSRAPYIRIGRFKLVSITPGMVWIADGDGGEAGSFDEKALEAALLKFFTEEF